MEKLNEHLQLEYTIGYLVMILAIIPLSPEWRVIYTERIEELKEKYNAIDNYPI